MERSPFGYMNELTDHNALRYLLSWLLYHGLVLILNTIAADNKGKFMKLHTINTGHLNLMAAQCLVLCQNRSGIKKTLQTKRTSAPGLYVAC